MIAGRIQVDHTLPPAQFQAALKREAHRVREETRLMRMWEAVRAHRLQVAETAFKRMGWTDEAARELAEFHVQGLSS